MANVISAEKRIRQTERRNTRNVACRNRIRTFVRKVEDAIASGDKETAQTSFKAAMSELHRGVTKGVLKKATASRKISRLSAAVKAL